VLLELLELSETLLVEELLSILLELLDEYSSSTNSELTTIK